MIRAIALELRRDRHTFTIKWIPGHPGVKGNELAKNAEREALSRIPENSPKVSSSEATQEQ
ncbi:hypothetical protein HPB47_021351 [Ixodes persulcatus]|uniref:Uncharacterized protein n=1 Tax=Ixodes persulcatus TaxID=34615 RepID=A0AC60QCR9_IXOPE|nr:hypothetical protein HPB47_021351 [Ixodes persulcatus]